MSPAPIDAVIRFEPDGYDIKTPRLMGRQTAGNGFLRAAVRGRSGSRVYGYTDSRESAEMFAGMVRDIDPAADPIWVRLRELDRIGDAGGVLQLADSSLTLPARERLRAGVANHSLCGVTHTTATPETMQQIADLLLEPLTPWDALICTSTAVRETVRRVTDAQADLMRWRLGPAVRFSAPQLPVIPLGVHCRDFAFADADKAGARTALEIRPEELVVLFVGRLVFAGKAHPFPAFLGLQAVAARTGRKLVLLQCGWAPNESIAQAFATGAQAYAPDVRTVTVDGRDDQIRRNAWAAGDIFISMSDGIQETFGLTPIEAMAAGLPVVVSDWNGYRDTVRDGVDGFRIPTWAPEASAAGADISARQEFGAISYDSYCWAAASVTSVDMTELVDRLTVLVEQPELRRRMGDAGQKRALEVFDWAQVFKQYQALWRELSARRLAALSDPEERAWAAAAPRVAPGRLDPFHAFGHYPTSRLTAETLVSLLPGATLEACRDRLAHVLFTRAPAPEPVVLLMWAELEKGETSIAALSAAASMTAANGTLVAGVLAKMGIVRLRGPAPSESH